MVDDHYRFIRSNKCIAWCQQSNSGCIWIIGLSKHNKLSRIKSRDFCVQRLHKSQIRIALITKIIAQISKKVYLSQILRNNCLQLLECSIILEHTATSASPQPSLCILTIDQYRSAPALHKPYIAIGRRQRMLAGSSSIIFSF